jgi:hypothetical protein
MDGIGNSKDLGKNAHKSDAEAIPDKGNRVSWKDSADHSNFEDSMIQIPFVQCPR